MASTDTITEEFKQVLTGLQNLVALTASRTVSNTEGEAERLQRIFEFALRREQVSSARILSTLSEDNEDQRYTIRCIQAQRASERRIASALMEIIQREAEQLNQDST